MVRYQGGSTRNCNVACRLVRPWRSRARTLKVYLPSQRFVYSLRVSLLHSDQAWSSPSKRTWYSVRDSSSKLGAPYSKRSEFCWCGILVDALEAPIGVAFRSSLMPLKKDWNSVTGPDGRKAV